jgi:hypothetical protein
LLGHKFGFDVRPAQIVKEVSVDAFEKFHRERTDA